MMNHSEYIEKVNKLDEEIQKLLAEKYKLSRENSQYYIGKITMIDGDGWDEYYTRLGFTTGDVVNKWVEEESKKENVYDVEVFTVDETEYEKYYVWYLLDRMVKATDISYSPTAFREHKDDAEFINATHIRLEEMLDDYVVDFVGEFTSYSHILEDTDIRC